tara:strand:+ start:153 stop:338 length:186 start_codon:yes stop_codon:yes gene_type:complete
MRCNNSTNTIARLNFLTKNRKRRPSCKKMVKRKKGANGREKRKKIQRKKHLLKISKAKTLS